MFLLLLMLNHLKNIEFIPGVQSKAERIIVFFQFIWWLAKLRNLVQTIFSIILGRMRKYNNANFSVNLAFLFKLPHKYAKFISNRKKKKRKKFEMKC